MTESTFGPPGVAAGLHGSISASHVYADDGVYAVTVTVTDDDEATSTDTLTITVQNMAPRVEAGVDQTANEGDLVSLASRNFNDLGTLDTHTATVGWGDGTPIEIGTVTESPFGPPGDTAGMSGRIAFASHVNAVDGIYTVTVTVTNDDGGVGTASTTLTVNPVNYPPSFNKGPDQDIPEDAGTQHISGWATDIIAGPLNELGQGLAFTATNNNIGLFAEQPEVNPSGDLTFTPAPDTNGSALVILTLRDDGGTANGGTHTSPPQTFNINVNSVNAAPTFAKGPAQVMLEDSGAQSVPGWAASIITGSSDESGQGLAFTVTNDNIGLFSSSRRSTLRET